jgi:multidrug efflux pump subunit AcrA (membrane-fusion protein)
VANRVQSIRRSARRAVDRIFDSLGARPLGLVVFALSVALLVTLQLGIGGNIRADAIATATMRDHPALVSSFVIDVYVHPGDTVEVGAPLVELSPHFIDRELDQIDAEVQKLLQESELAQARLVVKEQRWMDPDTRIRPDRPSLEDPTQLLYARELALLQTRRNQLLADRMALTMTAAIPGRVAFVVAVGSSVATGGSVATLSPEFAQEIVAYVPSEVLPEAVVIGAPVYISRSTLACSGAGRVLRRGASVEEAPGQLRSMFRFPVHGMPVYVSIPSGCAFGIGQVLGVEFARAMM